MKLRVTVAPSISQQLNYELLWRKLQLQLQNTTILYWLQFLVAKQLYETLMFV